MLFDKWLQIAVGFFKSHKNSLNTGIAQDFRQILDISQQKIAEKSNLLEPIKYSSIFMPIKYIDQKDYVQNTIIQSYLIIVYQQTKAFNLKNLKNKENFALNDLKIPNQISNSLFKSSIDFYNQQISFLIQQPQIMKSNYLLNFSQENFDQNQVLPKYSQGKLLPMIEGVTIIASDSEGEEEDQAYHISIIKKKLQEFKKLKAREVVAEHKRKKQSIDDIIGKMKSKIYLQALSIIRPTIKDVTYSQQKHVKEEKSTLPSTNCKSKLKNAEIQFSNDAPQKCESRNQKQFTLGHKNQFQSNQSNKAIYRSDYQVSQFEIQQNQPSLTQTRLPIQSSQHR